MCAIMGYTAADIPLSRLENAFSAAKSRGPDGSRSLALPGGSLLFHRLAIMGLHPEGMQPFTAPDGSAVVCNGELYGFRQMKRELEAKGYAFSSGSDCELLLPLWREYGEDMFDKLDAEFALILYDAPTGSFVAARDPVGIRPLYYGYSSSGRILFASEPKCLLGLADRIMPFPPGCFYRDGRFVRYRDIAQVDEICRDSLDVVCANIREKLILAVEKRLDADVPVGFLLSGGLDSSLVCAIAARLLGRPIETYAVGMSTDAIDLKYARQAADHIGSRHHEIYITEEDVLSALDQLIYILGTYDITTIRASMGMYLLCRAIREQSGVRVLLTGEISDELFGYKYTDFAPSPEAFQAEAVKRIREVHMYDVLRADRCISVNGLEARVPFGDLDFVRYVMSVDPARKVNVYNKGKYLLRRAFAGDCLPAAILQREKAAFSDAVGHSLVDDLKAHAERVCGADWRDRAEQYAYHAKPFTKESLLYREIFERHYPGQAAMVADFWMPNREWEGCDVDDPSARVLSNYGASGE